MRRKYRPIPIDFGNLPIAKKAEILAQVYGPKIKCPYCQKEIGDDSIYCPYCTKKLPENAIIGVKHNERAS